MSFSQLSNRLWVSDIVFIREGGRAEVVNGRGGGGGQQTEEWE